MGYILDSIKALFTKNTTNAASVSGARVPIVSADGTPIGNDSLANLASVLGAISLLRCAKFTSSNTAIKLCTFGARASCLFRVNFFGAVNYTSNSLLYVFKRDGTFGGTKSDIYGTFDHKVYYKTDGSIYVENNVNFDISVLSCSNAATINFEIVESIPSDATELSIS